MIFMIAPRPNPSQSTIPALLPSPPTLPTKGLLWAHMALTALALHTLSNAIITAMLVFTILLVAYHQFASLVVLASTARALGLWLNPTVSLALLASPVLPLLKQVKLRVPHVALENTQA